MTTERLRKCPTCRTDIGDTDLGLRDWSGWLGDTFPGKVGPMDLDWVLERKGNFLIIEFKSQGAPMPMGQRITLSRFHKMGCDVWEVREPRKYGDPIGVTVMNERHNFNREDMLELSLPKFKRLLATWWKVADA